MLKELVQSQTCGLNREIEILETGGQLVVVSRQIAVDFDKRHSDVLEKIDTLINEMDSTEKSVQYFILDSYKDKSGKSNKEYLLTKDGFSLLVMGFTGSKALEWKLKYIEAFNKMENKLKEEKPNDIEDLIIMQARSMKDLKQQVNQVNNNALEAKATAEESKQEIQGIRDIVALSPNQWKEDTAKLINKIANKLGGFEHISPIRKEVYRLLDNTYGVKLNTRLLNKQKKMALEGVPKYKIDKVNNLDVIADDKKLINGYVNIVSKLAIKYGV